MRVLRLRTHDWNVDVCGAVGFIAGVGIRC